MVVPKERPGNVVEFDQAKRSAPPADEKRPAGDPSELERLRQQVAAGHEFITSLDVLAAMLETEADEGDLLDGLDQALERVIRAIGAGGGALLVRDETTDDLVFALAWGDTPKSELLWKRVPRGQGIAHWVAKNRRPVIVNDVSNDERFYKEIDKANGFRTRSILAAPLLREDEVLGVVEVLNKRAGAYFTVSDQNHLTLLAHLASLALSELSRRKA